MNGNYGLMIADSIAKEDGSKYSELANTSLSNASSTLDDIFKNTSTMIETSKQASTDLFNILGEKGYKDKDGNVIGPTGFLGITDRLAKEEATENKQQFQQEQREEALDDLYIQKNNLAHTLNNEIQATKNTEKDSLVQQTTGMGSLTDYERSMDIFIANKFSNFKGLSKEDLVRMSRFPDTIHIEAIKRGQKPEDLVKLLDENKHIISLYSGIKLKEEEIDNGVFSEESNRKLSEKLYEHSKYLYPDKTSEDIFNDLKAGQLVKQLADAENKFKVSGFDLERALKESGVKLDPYRDYLNGGNSSPNASGSNSSSGQNVINNGKPSQANNTKLNIAEEVKQDEGVIQAEEDFKTQAYGNNSVLIDENLNPTKNAFAIDKAQTEEYDNYIKPNIEITRTELDMQDKLLGGIEIAGAAYGIVRSVGGKVASKIYKKAGDYLTNGFNAEIKLKGPNSAYNIARAEGKSIIGAARAEAKAFRRAYLTGTKEQRKEITDKILSVLPENLRNGFFEFVKKHYGKMALGAGGIGVAAYNSGAILDYLDNLGVVEKHSINQEMNKGTDVDKDKAVSTTKKVLHYFRKESIGTRTIAGIDTGKLVNESGAIQALYDISVNDVNGIAGGEGKTSFEVFKESHKDFYEFFGTTDFDKVELDLLYVAENDSWAMGENFYISLYNKISFAKSIQSRIHFLEKLENQHNALNPKHQDYKGVNRDITVAQVEGRKLEASSENKEAIKNNQLKLSELEQKQRTQKISNVNANVGDKDVNVVNPTMAKTIELLTGNSYLELNKNSKIDFETSQEEKDRKQKEHFTPQTSLDIPLAIYFEKSIHRDTDSVAIFNKVINSQEYKELVNYYFASQTTKNVNSSKHMAKFESEVGELIIATAKKEGIVLRTRGENGKESMPLSSGRTLLSLSDRKKFRFAEFVTDVGKAGKLTQEKAELLLRKYR